MPKDMDAVERTPAFLKLKTEIFQEVVANKMVDTYEKEMQSAGFTQEEVSRFRDAVIPLGYEDSDAIYAFPWELKQRALPAFLKKIRDGKETVEGMVEKIVAASKQQHRQLAFHASNDNIVPKEETSQGMKVKSWVIYGKEKDHRDNDLPMAYYSFDYMNLYRSKNPQYIYVVSIQRNETSGNRKDGNDQWGRAPSLSIVEKFDLRELELEVDGIAQERKKETAKPQGETGGLAA